MFGYIVQMFGYTFRQILWISVGHSKKKQKTKNAM